MGTSPAREAARASSRACRINSRSMSIPRESIACAEERQGINARDGNRAESTEGKRNRRKERRPIATVRGWHRPEKTRAYAGLTIQERGNTLLRMVENLGRLSQSDFLNAFPSLPCIR